MDTARIAAPAARRLPGLPIRVAGAALLTATGAIHLDLYVTGYRTVPTIGWLFLLQVIAAFALAVAVLVSGSRVAALAGAGFALSTLGGYLLSLWFGLFGFREVRTTAGIAAGIIEIAAFAVLASLALTPAGHADRRHLPGRLAAWLHAGAPGRTAAIAAASAAAVAVLAVSAAEAGSIGTASLGSGRTVLKTARIGGATVLTNAQGLTLYWFAPDTPARSACSGSCAAYWPPVKGPATAGPGVTGKLTVIKRSDGTMQAVYDGHPLYTYIADSGPGQAKGNGLNLNGGLWHEITLPG
jgi:predicted lipoprotein with Yx(FWY)xxD motif